MCRSTELRNQIEELRDRRARAVDSQIDSEVDSFCIYSLRLLIHILFFTESVGHSND
jgi:hypothetical protein